jgi:site-specific recombinase XerD
MELTYDAVKLVVTEYLRVRNYSPLTLKNALEGLKQFQFFLDDRGVNDYRDVKEHHYYEYFEKLKVRKLKKNTLKCYSC